MGALTRITRRYKVEISFLLLVLGILFTILAVFGIFMYDSTPDTLKEVVDSVRGERRVDYWLILIGPIFLGVGGFYLSDIRKKKKELESFLESDSKAAFIRNMDDIEYLGWYLGEPYNTRVMQKKRELKIK